MGHHSTHVHRAGEWGDQDTALDFEFRGCHQTGGTPEAMPEKPQAAGGRMVTPADRLRGERNGSIERFADPPRIRRSFAIPVTREID